MLLCHGVRAGGAAKAQESRAEHLEKHLDFYVPLMLCYGLSPRNKAVPVCCLSGKARVGNADT